ncbi:MAG: sensor histidine kinase [Phormidesmis sp.]
MGKAIQLQNHPFRFLLYLEWGLLAVAIVSAMEVAPGPAFRRSAPLPHNPVWVIVALLLFGLMGLYLPQNRQKVQRLGHTLGQVLLILVLSVTSVNGGRIFPMVYLIFVIRSCLMFGLVGRLMMTSVAFVMFVTGLQFRLRSLSGLGRTLAPPVRRRLGHVIVGLQLNFIVLFGLSLLLAVLLINALLTERRSQKRLQQANQTLRQSAQEIEKLAMEQERSRIARDIHDALGHSLTALNIQLESALKLLEKDPPRAHQFLKEAKRLGSQSLQDVRQSVAALRQDPLAGVTLEEAVVKLLADLEKDQRIKTTQTISMSQPLPTNLSVILYRIVQEGLTNVVKHADASHVHLQLVSSAAVVTLTLEDDGKGFDRGKASTGFGLQSMGDRAKAVGGTFTITSPVFSNAGHLERGADGGTRIQVSLPVTSLSIPS